MDFLKEFYLEFLVPVCAFVGPYSYFYVEKLRKRVNYMNDVLIRNGVCGEYDLCEPLHGFRRDGYDEEDFYLSKLRRRVSELETTIAEMKGEQDDKSNRST
jgi:hypothetical protein